MAKIVSTMIEPVSSAAAAGPAIGDDRQQRAAQRVLDHDRPVRQAERARGADMVGAQRFDHRAAHQPGDDGDLRQGQGEHRADLVEQRAVAPAADRQQFQVSPNRSWITGAMTKVGIVLPAVAMAMTA